MGRSFCRPRVVSLALILLVLLAGSGCDKREEDPRSNATSAQPPMDPKSVQMCQELADRQIRCSTAFEGCTQAPATRGAEQGFSCYCYFYWCMHGKSGAEGDPFCRIR